MNQRDRPNNIKFHLDEQNTLFVKRYVNPQNTTASPNVQPCAIPLKRAILHASCDVLSCSAALCPMLH